MSEHDSFLLVTPDGWTEAEASAVAILASHGYRIPELSEMINGNDWNGLRQAFEDAGILPENTTDTISEARVINTGVEVSSMRVWYKLAVV